MQPLSACYGVNICHFFSAELELAHHPHTEGIFWACFPTARLPTARFFGWCLGGMTFNLNLSGQFLRAVRKLHAIGQKNLSDRTKKRNFAGRENILHWNNTLKPCEMEKISKDESVLKLVL